MPSPPTEHSSLPADVMLERAIRHHGEGRLKDAEGLYRSILAINPKAPHVLHLLGVLAHQAGDTSQAITLIEQAVNFRSDVAEFHYNLGAAYGSIGRQKEAAACYRRSIQIDPNNPFAFNNLADALRKLDQPREAISWLRRAIDLRPDFAEAFNNPADVLISLGEPAEAEPYCREALRLKPDFPQALNNLGNALNDQENLSAASDVYGRVLGLDPNNGAALNNLGHLLQKRGRVADAVRLFRQAVLADPTAAEARFNLGLALLTLGEMPEGWRCYESRWKTPALVHEQRPFSQPQWRGEAANGRTLLIHAEQGFGDTIQFCRFAPMAKRRGFDVVVEVQGPLVRLIETLPGVDKVIARGDPAPRFDIHCPMMSLPLAFKVTMDTIPAEPAYLSAASGQVATWWSKTSAFEPSIRVGLAWAGSARHKAVDRRRSMQPSMLAPLFSVPGVTFFSLQRQGAASAVHPSVVDPMGDILDFADTAALVSTLDLVITVDTAVGHLAAALGRPVWLLNRFDASWRWLAGRLDTPWYPTMRLYRQSTPGDWHKVIDAVRRDLEAFSDSRSGLGREATLAGLPDSPSATATVV